MKLSILDYVSIDASANPETAIAEMDQLARRADELGYEHYWVSEHHGYDSSASTAPEMLMARLASITNRIQVGSGGVMLPNYSSYKVAESFLTMASYAPGRINLGVGRSTGADRQVTLALNDEKHSHLPFEHKVADLLGFLGADHPQGSRYAGMRAFPRPQHLPTPWILGASGSTATLAAEHGIGFTFAHFINASGKGTQAAQNYRQNFQPSVFLDRPKVIVAVFAAVAETREHAELLEKAFHLWLIDTETRDPNAGLRSLDDVANHELTPAEIAAIEKNKGRILTGTGEEVYEEIEELATAYGADSVMINPYVPGVDNRIRAIELLAEARDRREKSEA
ncbi:MULTISPECIES: MsnO8 family LLM class oxidoreductase [unclassified Corynebacterium]|uniref:MsnO8 family LLM class oxidoreductase n=1 Tax=unclassified Corynebacterium TaxID=2624378 RepID=UPI0029CA1933|nr:MULTISPECIES: MsnO8 family LLM class oxidoreductase [unclassified Corynebacterium]WPF65782.1 MsnO8 family LLM class oxidoreductase [Corynebacterium sp. 22KM0430]WPF68276.1 MsnO8 family LLM class oxidoreductase [Corynebacterium sp. 21KM1197]